MYCLASFFLANSLEVAFLMMFFVANVSPGLVQVLKVLFWSFLVILLQMVTAYVE